MLFQQTRSANNRLFLLMGVVFTSAVLCVAEPARGECGDTDGDGAVTVSDALRTLRKSVGQEVVVTCSADPIVNSISFVNMMFCGGSSFTARMTWSERPGLEWTAFSDPYLPVSTANDQRVDDLELDGTLEFDFGECGQASLRLGEQGLVFPLPNNAEVAVILLFQDSDHEMYAFINIEPRQAVGPEEPNQVPVRVEIGQQIAIGALDMSTQHLSGLQ